MAEDADWRHGKDFDYVDRLDPAGLAWEFLRRNRKYQDDFEEIPKQKRDTANDRVTQWWGVRFPSVPDPARHRRGYLLRPRCRPWSTAPDAITAGLFIR
ncbi:hypothetical protein GGD81_002175 [Rhodobium orientis]|uniref:Transcriptional regulator-like domain-containing protein n=1 Tax=Rhodobium orientis TaxID=34017 RepID=A0A327JQ00_9HYPH|nr:DUF6499 domain-containing protein [Rhodobium orientis]MBB4303132.1 hypothetical protein [Rhodobium orientis]RAI26942.1 hypothetical protein CH339_12200 [Rhodobium orientis]